MTEAEWLAGENPELLWEHIRRQASRRKANWAGIAFCENALVARGELDQHDAELAALHAHADGVSDSSRLGAVHVRLAAAVERAARTYHWSGDPAWVADRNMERALLAATAGSGPPIADTLRYALGAVQGGGDVRRLLALLIRDIFGNPFCPIALAPSWRTSTVVALAEGIYADRAFDRLPILADALQDAGCDKDDILAHCRGPGPHARGCWVIDLVLGKA